MKISPFASSLLVTLGLASIPASHADGVSPRNSHLEARSLLASTALGNGAQLNTNVNSPQNGAQIEVGNKCTAPTTMTGSASVGKGNPNVSYIFIIDQSGSTSGILEGIKTFFKDLTDVVFNEGSALNAGVVLFASNVDAMPALTNDSTAIKAKISAATPKDFTNCAGALKAAKTLASTSTAATTIVLFAGDGECNVNEGETVTSAKALGALQNTKVIIETIAINGIPCSGDLGTIPQNGGSCNAVKNVSEYKIASVIGTTLKNVALSRNGAAYKSLATVPSGDTAGPVEKTFSEAITIDLGSNSLCVKATGSDQVSNKDVDVFECIAIQGIDTSAPAITCPSNIDTTTDLRACVATVDVGVATAVDNCSKDLNPVASTTGPFPLDTTSVTFSVSDASGNSAACDISVTVTDNEAPVLVCPADLTVNTDSGICTATINEIPVATVTDNCDQSLTPSTTAVNPFALGSTAVVYNVEDAAGNPDSCAFAIVVQDKEAPSATCTPANNPSGNVPAANNQDGFFTLGGSDNCSVASYHVVDSVSGFVFGPFPSGTVFKYVQAPGGKPSQKPGTGKVNYFLQGKGDAYVLVTDGSGNTAKASCLVPPKPSRLLRGN